MKQRVIITELICHRCGHRWMPRKKPVLQCAKCKSVHWQTPKPAPKEAP